MALCIRSLIYTQLLGLLIARNSLKAAKDSTSRLAGPNPLQIASTSATPPPW